MLIFTPGEANGFGLLVKDLSRTQFEVHFFFVVPLKTSILVNFSAFQTTSKVEV